MLVRLLFGVLFWIPLFAQEAGAPVVIDGRELLRVYASMGQFTPADRAQEIQHRIITLAEKGYTEALETRAVPSEKATAVIAGPVMVMAVTDADAEPEKVAQAVLAKRYAATIQDAIKSYRTNHTWMRLMLSVLKTLLAWAVFCFGVWALFKAVRWLDRRLQYWFNRIESVRGSSRFYRLIWERVRILLTMLVKVIAIIWSISAFSFLLSYTFGLFPQTAGISVTLMDHLRSTFGTVALAIVNYLPSGGFVIAVALLTHYVLKLLKFLATAIEQGDLTIKGMHPEMGKPTFQLARVTVILFALVVAFPYLPGGQSEAFKGVSIFVGVVLSLGSSSAVGNVLAGLVLTYMRPFRVGDRVKIVDTTGDIVEKSLLVTRVRTIKNVEVVIPNGAILGNQILNFSALARTKGLILHTTVTIGYDAPWRTVHELLIDAALATDGILEQPRPFVLETSLNDFHISYELNAYTDRPNDMVDIYSHLHEAIQDSFNKAGVEIMSPTFYALRDGNTVTIPAGDRPTGYEAPSFRVNQAPPPTAASGQ
jgi:small-conductance mechanosensitive channel